MKLNEVLQNRITLTGKITLSKLKNDKLKNSIIDVDGLVNITNKKLKIIPVKFGKVDMFFAEKNELTTLENCPEEAKEMHLSNNLLTTLKGCPEKVDIFYCSDNLLTNLEFAPKYMMTFGFENNKITSLVGIHKNIIECDYIEMSNNVIEEGGIGLIFIKNLHELDDFYLKGCGTDFINASKIINKYLGQGKSGLLECQEELEEAGLGQFAKL